ncbi:MAG: glycosyltransferase [Fimbriimonadaceae bacterium]
MKVALIHEWLTVPAGSEEVFAEMCDLFPGVVHSSIIDKDRCGFLKGLECRASFLSNLPLAKKKHWLYAPLMPLAYRNFDMSEFDLLLTSSHSFAHGVRKRPGALHICYYHTPARSLWVPEIDGRASKSFLHRAIANWLKPKDLEASKGPDFLLANSHTIAARLKKFYGRDVHRVIYPPVKTERWNSVQRVSEDEGFLYWGRLIDYKRVDLLIEAVRETGDKLNIVGSGPLELNLKEQAAGMKNVIFHGRLSDEQLAGLMGRCRAVLFAAYEDFGIVPVEAMAAGLPVVAYAQGGAAETVLPEFGVQFPEQTSSSLVAGIKALSGRQFEPGVLKKHAAQFDVKVFREHYAKTVNELYEMNTK